jgi:hypothetical protein
MAVVNLNVFLCTSAFMFIYAERDLSTLRPVLEEVADTMRGMAAIATVFCGLDYCYLIIETKAKPLLIGN